ncbi:MAG: HAMP domain-containing histidine kinase, partial [Rubrivivax sp.]
VDRQPEADAPLAGMRQQQRLGERLGRSFNVLFIPIALMAAALLLPHAGQRRVGLWLAVYAAFLGVRQLVRHISLSRHAGPVGLSLRTASLLGAVNAALLGSLAWWSHGLLPWSSHLMLTVLMATVASLLAGVGHDFTAMLRAYLVLLLGPFALGWFASAQPLSAVMGTAIVMLAAVLEATAYYLRRASLVRARLQVDNQRLSRNLAAQVAELDTLNRSKTRLLAAASHDLRQPAHAMGMTIDSMLAQPHENLLPRLQLLERSNTRLVGMLATLMDLARLDSGSFDALPTAIELDDVMEEAGLQLQGAAEQKGLTLRVHPSGLRVVSDAYLLRRMLLNLLGNAVKYTAQGGVTLSAQRHGAEGSQVVLSVADTGVGIPAPLQAGVFEAYTRLERSGEGLGIGLAVVRAACDLLGHEVRLSS